MKKVGGTGGSLYHYSTTHLWIIDSVFKNNFADSFGGVIEARRLHKVLITRTLF